MAALGVAMIAAGAYLCYVAYEAIHDKTTAHPLTKASSAVS